MFVSIPKPELASLGHQKGQSLSLRLDVVVCHNALSFYSQTQHRRVGAFDVSGVGLVVAAAGHLYRPL